MIEIVSDISFALLALAIGMTLLRLVRGPTVADRVVALDLLSLLGIAAVSVFALRVGFPLYLDVAAGLCAVSFVATAALARYLFRAASR